MKRRWEKIKTVEVGENSRMRRENNRIVEEEENKNKKVEW